MDDAERERIDQYKFQTILQEAVADDPAAAAASAVERLHGDSHPYVVHFDADSVDFADALLAQKSEERNIALPLDVVMTALHGVSQ